MVACVGVYRNGEAPLYSLEEVAAAFRPIAVPVYAALALAVGGAVLHLLLPAEAERLRAPYRPARVLRSLRKRAVLTEEQQGAARRAQKTLRMHNWITALLAVAASCLFTVLPGLKELSSGWAIIIITLLVSALAATLFPIKVEDEEVQA